MLTFGGKVVHHTKYKLAGFDVTRDRKVGVNTHANLATLQREVSEKLPAHCDMKMDIYKQEVERPKKSWETSPRHRMTGCIQSCQRE